MGMLSHFDGIGQLGEVAPINPTIHIAAFGLPVSSCAASRWCTHQTTAKGGFGHCYAMHGSFVYGTVQRAFARNLSLSFCSNFADLMSAELDYKGITTFRVFVSGDFPHVGNAAQWAEVVRRHPKTWFTFFTRKWVIPAYQPGIIALTKFKNVTMMTSYDPEMAKQYKSPDVVLKDAKIGISYVDFPLEFLQQANAVVCPKTGGEEDRKPGEPMTHPDCDRCGYCYGAPDSRGHRSFKTPRVYYVAHGGGYSASQQAAAQLVAEKLGKFPPGPWTMKTWKQKVSGRKS